MNQLLIKDLKFIQNLAPDLADTVIEMFAVNVDEVFAVLQEDSTRASQFLSDLNTPRKAELVQFYESTLEVFTELERYEDCVKVMYILESLNLFEV